VRNPLDQYISLYSHGCGGSGGLFHRLRAENREDLYDSSMKGFREWMRFLFEPENAGLLDADFAEGEPKLCTLIGFQTYRYLELAMLDPFKTLHECKTQDDVRKAYKEKAIVDFTIRHETFNADVEMLLTAKIPHAIKNLDAALAYLREGLTERIRPRRPLRGGVDARPQGPRSARAARMAHARAVWILIGATCLARSSRRRRR